MGNQNAMSMPLMRDNTLFFHMIFVRWRLRAGSMRVLECLNKYIETRFHPIWRIPHANQRP